MFKSNAGHVPLVSTVNFQTFNKWHLHDIQAYVIDHFKGNLFYSIFIVFCALLWSTLNHLLCM